MALSTLILLEAPTYLWRAQTILYHSRLRKTNLEPSTPTPAPTTSTAVTAQPQPQASSSAPPPQKQHISEEPMSSISDKYPGLRNKLWDLLSIKGLII